MRKYSKSWVVQDEFEEIISSFLDNRVGLSSHFLNKGLADHLKMNLLALLSDNQLAAAGIGNAEFVSYDSSVRSDAIFWLDRKHNNQTENLFFDLIDAFVRHLNMTCYAGITDYEFHYSMYEKGAFYQRHLDQFQNNSNRKYSMISYLNENWQEVDGGQLLIHQDGNETHIDPVQGRTVFFKSDELEHEVLVTNARRMSITGWLKGN